MRLTRAMNGEHEYRFFEWDNFFKKCKLKVLKRLIVRESSSNVINDAASINKAGVTFSEPKIEMKKIQSWKNRVIKKKRQVKRAVNPLDNQNLRIHKLVYLECFF